MKPETSDDTYETWLEMRRRDFTGTDLSFLVMASVRTDALAPVHRSKRTASGLAYPSTVVGVLRLVFLVILILTPA